MPRAVSVLGTEDSRSTVRYVVVYLHCCYSTSISSRLVSSAHPFDRLDCLVIILFSSEAASSTLSSSPASILYSYPRITFACLVFQCFRRRPDLKLSSLGSHNTPFQPSQHGFDSRYRLQLCWFAIRCSSRRHACMPTAFRVAIEQVDAKRDEGQGITA